MSKSQKVLALAAMASHLLGDQSMDTAGQSVVGNRSGAASPGSVWELSSREINGVWYRAVAFTSYRAWNQAMQKRAEQVKQDEKRQALAEARREARMARLERLEAAKAAYQAKVAEKAELKKSLERAKEMAMVGKGVSYNCAPRPAIVDGVSRLINVGVPVAPAPKTAKPKAKPATPISRRVREVAAHVAWCLAEAASAALATTKVAKMEKVKGAKVAKKVAAQRQKVAAMRKEGAVGGELLRAWSRA